jgi:DNA primase
VSSINADKLKEYIVENNCIEQILLSVDCHDLHEYTSEWRAALPQGTNKTAVCVKKDNLSVIIRNSAGNTRGDIFTLVMTLKHMSFGQANKFIHKELGLKYSYKKNSKEEIKKDPLAIFKKIKRQKYIIDNKNIPVYDDNCLKEYIDLPYIGWVREGILPSTCKKFHIGYSYDRKRIVIPERKWDGDDNEYIGISGRTTVPNYELFDIPKYFKLSNTYPKGFNVYGLNENYQTIQEAGYCVVMESQKSVLKRYSRKDGTCVAIGNCEITAEQVRILISLNVEIVIALDEGININHVRKECDKFYPIRKVSYIYDTWGLIEKGSKDSPADKENKIYNFLFKHRIPYDNTERVKLKKWQESQKKN